jgi:hypothetical protein
MFSSGHIGNFDHHQKYNPEIKLILTIYELPFKTRSEKPAIASGVCLHRPADSHFSLIRHCSGLFCPTGLAANCG